MNIERMVEMVNDIANFFASEPDHSVAITGVAVHLKRFWEARMIRQMLAHLDAGGHGLSDLAREGVQELARMQRAA
ncbi:MAG: formate dehydrogenase subunit delta [Rhodanobacteraceae bacterium]